MLSKPLQENIDLIEMGKYLKKLKWDKEDLEHAKKYIEQIAFLSEEKFMSQDFKGLDEFEYFIANNNKILIPTIGQYSSGKSSLLNILIGNHYLPTSDGVCTNKGVIIEYTPDKNIAELYEIKLNLERKYFSFVKSKKICDDKKKIEGEIDKINKEHKAIKLEDSFLLLKVHIEFFELLEEEFREKILLIDFPGLGVLKNKNFFSSDVLGPLINQSDSFLFFNPEVVNSDENQQIIINIVERIKNRKISFSYKNCLFIMNKQLL
jgi:GTPase SAR1 family protein